MKKELKPLTLNGHTYQRIPVKTHLIHIKEDFYSIINKYVVSQHKKGDWIAISEKFITISEGRVIHISAVKPGWLAKTVIKGVRKYSDDIGYSSPYKMQVAIWQAGWWRVFVAMIVGGLGKLIGRHGDFYRIAGNRISEIDGFNPAAMPPFNEFAMLGPSNPEKIANEIEAKFGIPVVIIDGNNINVEVLGQSKGVPLSKEDSRLVLLDNPMGQNDELTPIIILREGKI